MHLKLLSLVKTAISFALYSIKEEAKVRKKYCWNIPFKKCDRTLQRRYRWKNPYAISRRFLSSRGATDVHTYGETPLTSLEQIAKKSDLTREDLLLDLGCGRGRGAFFFHYLVGCKVMGIDWNPTFIKEAKEVAAQCSCPVDFVCSDMTRPKIPFIDQATFIYAAWTCMEEEERSLLEENLLQMRPGTRVVTVSVPLSSENFIIKEKFEVSFPWGEAEIFLHERCKLP